MIINLKKNSNLIYLVLFLVFFLDILITNIIGHQVVFLSLVTYIILLLNKAFESKLILSGFLISILAFVNFEHFIANFILVTILFLISDKLLKNIDSKYVIAYIMVFLSALWLIIVKNVVLGQKIGLTYTFLTICVNITLISLILKFFIRHEPDNHVSIFAKY